MLSLKSESFKLTLALQFVDLLKCILVKITWKRLCELKKSLGKLYRINLSTLFIFKISVNWLLELSGKFVIIVLNEFIFFLTGVYLQAFYNCCKFYDVNDKQPTKEKLREV